VPLDPQVLVERDLAQLRERLLHPPGGGGHDEAAITQTRDEAARRLLSRRSAKAHKILADALADPRLPREIKISIVKAIADDAQPDPAFVAGLLPLLGTERTLSDPTARALAHYPDNAIVRAKLIAAAQDINLPAAVRAGVIRASGAVVSRDVADAMVTLSGDPYQPPAIQNAAADALTEITGVTTLGHDAARWKQWQTANANKPEIVWKADALARRNANAAHYEHAQADFVNELKQILSEQYQRADRDAKFAMVMRLVNSPDAQTREMGVQLVMDAHDTASPFPPQALQRLPELVGDSDADMRLMAANAIKSLNDTDALDALLTQLPQETDPQVQVAQVAALVPMKRLRSVPELRQLLHNPSIRVATAAVDALKGLSPLLLSENPPLAREVAAELWQAGMQRGAEPGGIDFRAATIEAVGSLHARELVKGLLDLLNAANDERIRIAALRALGDIGDRNTSFPIAQWLRNEPSPAARIEAIKTLGSTTSFEDAAVTLYDFMQPATEPDKAVRDKAWVQFQSLLPSATNLEVINRWAANFQNDPSRRLPVLLSLNEKLQQRMQWVDLAASRQDTGDTYIKLGDPAKAALQFSQALDYWQQAHVANQVTIQLIQQLFNAYLAARDYKKATDFATKQIALDKSLQTLFGSTLVNEANRLRDVGDRDNDNQKLQDGLNLIDAALKMQPPLADHYQADLRQFQQDITQRMKPTHK